MTAKIKISAKLREAKKNVRKEGMIPAVIYGKEKESTPIAINEKEFNKLYKEAGESTLVNLEIENEKKAPSVLIYELQKDPLTGNILHVDFFEPNLKEEVEADIPLTFQGEAPAVKELSGTLIKNMYSINVKALPEKLPHDIEVDVSQLKGFDDVISVKDLDIPKDVEVMQEEETVIAMISAPEDVEAELEKPIEEGEEPEVIGEKEDEEGGEEKTEEENEEDKEQKEE